MVRPWAESETAGATRLENATAAMNTEPVLSGNQPPWWFAAQGTAMATVVLHDPARESHRFRPHRAGFTAKQSWYTVSSTMIALIDNDRAH